jgi:hypothetical protein
MTFADDSTGIDDAPAGNAADPGDLATGLPWLKSWLSVYVFVTICFVTWVVLLIVLERVFS